MIEEVTCFKTEDGTLFNSIDDAQFHQKVLATRILCLRILLNPSWASQLGWDMSALAELDAENLPFFAKIMSRFLAGNSDRIAGILQADEEQLERIMIFYKSPSRVSPDEEEEEEKEKPSGRRLKPRTR